MPILAVKTTKAVFYVRRPTVSELVRIESIIRNTGYCNGLPALTTSIIRSK